MELNRRMRDYNNMEGFTKMTIFLIDHSGNKRSVHVSRQATLFELLSSFTEKAYAINTGLNFLGPNYYNKRLDELNIDPGVEIEIIGIFVGGKN